MGTFCTHFAVRDRGFVEMLKPQQKDNIVKKPLSELRCISLILVYRILTAMLLQKRNMKLKMNSNIDQYFGGIHSIAIKTLIVNLNLSEGKINI